MSHLPPQWETLLDMPIHNTPFVRSELGRTEWNRVWRIQYGSPVSSTGCRHSQSTSVAMGPMEPSSGSVKILEASLQR